MEKRKVDINWFDLILYIFTWIGASFFTQIVASMIAGETNFYFVTDAFMVGKTEVEAYFYQTILYIIALVAVYFIHSIPHIFKMVYKKAIAITYTGTLLVATLLSYILKGLPHSPLSWIQSLISFTIGYYLIYKLYVRRDQITINRINEAIKTQEVK